MFEINFILVKALIHFLKRKVFVNDKYASGILHVCAIL